MAYPRLNIRSIRLFASTPDELERKRPNLHAPYFRVKRSELDRLLSLVPAGSDVVVSLGVWKRQGRDGKPDYFSAELTYPETEEAQQKYLLKDAEWEARNPRTVSDQQRRQDHAQAAPAPSAIPADTDFPF